MGEWQPIETFPDDTPFWTSDHADNIRYYDPVLVYGKTWKGGWDHDYPGDGGDFWTGEPEIFWATTYTGKGFFTAEPSIQDYETYIKPTHWMKRPSPPTSCPDSPAHAPCAQGRTAMSGATPRPGDGCLQRIGAVAFVLGLVLIWRW